jgi:hypothetical protein
MQWDAVGGRRYGRTSGLKCIGAKVQKHCYCADYLQSSLRANSGEAIWSSVTRNTLAFSAPNALKTTLNLFPKRRRLSELRPSGLGQRNQAIALVVVIRDHFDQPLWLERLDVVSQC